MRKAYYSVDHDWLCAMTDVHRRPIWLGEVISKLCASWNTTVVATTRQGRETSRKIRFMKGLPQGDALCPRLFTLCLNPVAWRLRATEGYRLSKPIGVKVTDLLYIDDLKVFGASESKLNRVLKESRGTMQGIGLHWHQKKCSVVHVKRGAQVLNESGMRMDETTTITALVVPFVTTFHPSNLVVEKIISRNFRILREDSRTSKIFNKPPLKAFRRAKNLKDLLVRNSLPRNLPHQSPGTFPCNRTVCRTCPLVNSSSTITTPKGHVYITGHFSCIT